MGCANSKQVLRRGRRRTSPPYARTYSLPLQSTGSASAGRNVASGDEQRHVVALTSSTLGSLRLDNSPDFSSDEEMMKITNDRVMASREGLFVAKEAKSWSDMIEQRLPRTPTVTPPDAEPETIDTWELMAGLEDASPIHPAAVGRAFSFHTSRDAPPLPEPIPLSPEQRPQWMQQLGATGDHVVTDFDPEILSSFREALEKLTPQHPSAVPQSTETEAAFPARMESAEMCLPPERMESAEVCLPPEVPKSTGIVRARINAFQQRIDAKKATAKINAAKITPFYKSPPDGKKKVVFYFTSLRGVRKTYEDCWEVRVILKSYGVRVDERDVSMHGGFKEELIEILGPGYGGKGLPRIFADGAYLGGAEEVRQMHEVGELRKALEGCETASHGKAGAESACDCCGDVRFVPCETCSGSCKVYVEQEEVDEDEEENVAEREELGGFRRCPDCNENGLVRCPVCCMTI